MSNYSMKNLLFQQDIKKKNRKILNIFSEKPPNLIENQRDKSNNQLDKKSLNPNRRQKKKSK